MSRAIDLLAAFADGYGGRGAPTATGIGGPKASDRGRASAAVMAAAPRLSIYIREPIRQYGNSYIANAFAYNDE
jgi:hypothetical protein